MKFQQTLALAACLCFCVHVAHAQQMTITAQCTTEATGGDGVRHACDSKPSTGTAPENHVFQQNKVVVSKTSGNGDESDCLFGWSDFVEVIPDSGITAPRTFTLSSHARGPSGHWAGRGWAECSATLGMAKYR